MKKVLVTGAGGFIGGHLVASLLKKGYDVRAVDIKPLNEWYQKHESAENISADMRLKVPTEVVVEGCEEVYNLAADMGGMGFIETHKAECMLTVLINTHHRPVFNPVHWIEMDDTPISTFILKIHKPVFSALCGHPSPLMRAVNLAFSLSHHDFRFIRTKRRLAAHS